MTRFGVTWLISSILAAALVLGVIAVFTGCAPLEKPAEPVSPWSSPFIPGTDVIAPEPESDGWTQYACFKCKPEFGKACCLYEKGPRWFVACTRDGDDWYLSEDGEGAEERTL